MRFSAATLLAFASVVLAQTPGFNVITAPAKGEKVPAGETYEIVWVPDAKNPGAITIELYGGPADNKLNLVETLKTGFDGSAGTYPWAVGSALGTEKVYGIRVVLESNTTIWQWGNPFEITKGSSSATVTVSTSVSATSTVEPSSTSTKVSSTIISTTAPESSKATSTTIKISSSIIHGNYSTTRIAPNTRTTEATETTFVIGTSSTGSATASSTSAVVTNGVAAMGASSFALLGGVAMAILAL